MKFNSWTYIVLLISVVPLYNFIPNKSAKLSLLCIVSLFFYAMWRWEFVFLMIFSSLIDYCASHQIKKSSDKHIKRTWLVFSLITNLGLLIFFKYSYFFDANLSHLSAWLGIGYGGLDQSSFKIILPLGISFYTFQTISYSIDVYRGIQQPTDNFFLFLTYVIFWPQLIAGPILRAGEVMPQLNNPVSASQDDIHSGINKIIIGLFKKVVLADNIAPLVDNVFSTSPQYLNAFDVWAGALLFGFQIYFDFSGYSDIAIGSAKLLGIKFPENFDWPYLSKSPKTFWKNWHITLSSWIRDYLYLPLTGRKFNTKSTGGLDISAKGISGSTVPLMLTWLIMGFWHGAGWNFAFWGILHALFILSYRKIKLLQLLENKWPVISMILTFAIVTAFWIPFRAVDITQSMLMLSKLLNPFEYNLDGQMHKSVYFYSLVLVISMYGLYFCKAIFYRQFSPMSRNAVRGFMVSTMTFFIIVYLQTVVQFIYFQF